MDDMVAFERQVADVARVIAGPPRPVDTLAIVRTTSGVSTGPVSRVRVTTTARWSWRWRSALSAMLLVLIATIALIGGLVLTGGTDEEEEEEEEEEEGPRARDVWFLEFERAPG